MNARTLALYRAFSYSQRTSFERAVYLLSLSLLAGIALITLDACSQSPVVIEKSSPQIKTVYFDKGVRPPEASPPEHNDCANTHWHYGFIPEVSIDQIARERVTEGEEVSFRIKKINIKLNLEITMWLPEKPTEDCLEHEKGHAAICVDDYKNAETIARDAAMPLIGKELVARGADYKTTIKQALTEVNQEMARRYREETVDKANVTAGLYDKMTVKDHAAAKVNQKVADAELEYTRILPELKERRAEAERQLNERMMKQGKAPPEPSMDSSAAPPKKP